MPGFDGTGPLGQGAMTGGARGRCAGAVPGTGMGRGFGRGLGMGRGRGWRAAAAVPVSSDLQVRELEEKISRLQAEVEALKRGK
ncbi:MAG: DUF5320 domain-containing protein [Elusimicrobia bacterium]|nr:DUF5320 domain-containing protein [Elusimicrobiota bacterium]